MGFEQFGDAPSNQGGAALAGVEGRNLGVLGADDTALVIVEYGPVLGAGKVVLGKLGRRARVDHGVE